MSRIIVKNIPKQIEEEKLKEHFSKKGIVTDLKIMRSENGFSRKFAFVGFKTHQQAQDSIKYFNNTYLLTSKVQVEEAKVQGDPTIKNKGKQKKQETRDKLESKQEKQNKITKLMELSKQLSNKNKFDVAEKKLSENNNKPKDSEQEENKEVEPNKPPQEEQADVNPRRLYLRNIPFETTEDDLKETFGAFGELTEVHIPKFKNQSHGYAYVAFSTVDSAIMAISELDNKYYQGRILHITPAKEKQVKYEEKPQETQETANSSYKKQKKTKLKADFQDETNWNYLFMNQDAIVEAISKQLNIPKNEIMSRDNPDIAIQVAAMETSIINETKDWLNEQGINLDVLRGKRSECLRSKHIILIKNIAPGTSSVKLEDLFNRYGHLLRFMLSPSNTLGIAEFVDSSHATNCIKKLAYHEINGVPLYLEFAPEGLTKNVNKQEENIGEYLNKEGKVLFISNLNFNTTDKKLEKAFKDNDVKPLNVRVVTHKKGDKDLSSGFGFAEFQDNQTAIDIVKNFQGLLVEGHSLKLSIAKTQEGKEKTAMLANKRNRETDLNDYEFSGEDTENNKLLIKNLAFEANKNELRKLFKNYGEVKTVRLPAKLDGTHRGFAFIDFVSHEEAKNAFKSLQNSHFYGRKLVLEWAKKEKTVEELRSDAERKLKASGIRTHRTQIKSNLKI